MLYVICNYIVNITTIKITEEKMNIQTVATKLLLKLPQPILNKLMRSVPKNNKNVKNAQKPWHLKGNWAPVEKELEGKTLK